MRDWVTALLDEIRMVDTQQRRIAEEIQDLKRILQKMEDEEVSKKIKSDDLPRMNEIDTLVPGI
ncbi:unnamed protein product [Eruca vesicaria subsp. sativa]|uniref:Uncharacterized protein n=1 Tax=Eruca vesicaria subsp. sativa TaxID=29727 RepID=A0ABC8JB24_ERUVS|nr:unnamed protein product [Eruca vesicaria subsp. sativa]